MNKIKTILYTILALICVVITGNYQCEGKYFWGEMLSGAGIFLFSTLAMLASWKWIDEDKKQKDNEDR